METVEVTKDVQLSMIDMFMHADLVVKAVMVGLLLASLLSWTIVFEKFRLFSRVRRENGLFDKRFWSDESPEKTWAEYKGKKALVGKASVFCAAMGELDGHAAKATRSKGFGSLHERVDRAMGVQMQVESQQLKAKLFILAIVGSAGPFIGLFGTVWGIMNSFKAIAASGATSLAVVAPGLAEALFATALGLIAAIPSVICYNILMSRFGDLMVAVANFAEEFSNIVARKLEA